MPVCAVGSVRIGGNMKAANRIRVRRFKAGQWRSIEIKQARASTPITLQNQRVIGNLGLPATRWSAPFLKSSRIGMRRLSPQEKARRWQQTVEKKLQQCRLSYEAMQNRRKAKNNEVRSLP